MKPDIAALRALHDMMLKAQPAFPFKVVREIHERPWVQCADGIAVASTDGHDHTQANAYADLIAAMLNALPGLLDAAEETEQLREAIGMGGSEFDRGYNLATVDSATAIDVHHMKYRPCPCMHTTPCHDRCSCVMATSSSGCRRCCTVGSPGQQRTKAIWLASVIDVATELP